MTYGRLAGHIAEIPGWIVETLEKSELDLQPPGAPPYTPPAINSTADLLAALDKNVTAARASIAKATDEQMMAPWSLLKGGQKIMTLPRIAVLRGFVFSHLIHHRGQLSVYMRLNGIPVPSIYGPSADEGAF